MNILILGGFLGSGKTTLLLRLAPELAAETSVGTPLVVLENELAATDVDSRLLCSQGLTVRSLTSGCICCTSSAALPQSIRQIREQYDPGWLIIEATGLAYPDVVAALAQEAAGAWPVVVVLADAARWEKFSRAMPEFAESQLRRADLVLLNKVDRVTPEKCQVLLASLRQSTGAPVYGLCLQEALLPEVIQAVRELGRLSQSP